MKDLNKAPDIYRDTDGALLQLQQIIVCPDDGRTIINFGPTVPEVRHRSPGLPVHILELARTAGKQIVNNSGLKAGAFQRSCMLSASLVLNVSSDS